MCTMRKREYHMRLLAAEADGEAEEAAADGRWTEQRQPHNKQRDRHEQKRISGMGLDENGRRRL